jgi:hypothetical protein
LATHNFLNFIGNFDCSVIRHDLRQIVDFLAVYFLKNVSTLPSSAPAVARYF